MQHFWKKTRENTFWFLEYAKFDVSPDNVFFKMSHIQIVKYRKVSVSIQECFNSLVKSRKWRHLYSKFNTRSSKVKNMYCTITRYLDCSRYLWITWRVLKYIPERWHKFRQPDLSILYNQAFKILMTPDKMSKPWLFFVIGQCAGWTSLTGWV